MPSIPSELHLATTSRGKPVNVRSDAKKPAHDPNLPLYNPNAKYVIEATDTEFLGPSERRRTATLSLAQPRFLNTLAWRSFFNEDCGRTARQASASVNGSVNMLALGRERPDNTTDASVVRMCSSHTYIGAYIVRRTLAHPRSCCWF
jgi:hypothetical protein